MVNSLYALRDAQDKPIFSIKFLVEKYLEFTEDDIALNEKYMQQEILNKLDDAKKAKEHAEYNAKNNNQTAAPGGGDEMSDFGGAPGMADFGGGDEMADFGGGGSEDFGGAGAEAGIGGGEEGF